MYKKSVACQEYGNGMYDEQCSLTNYSSNFVVLLKNDEIVEKFVEVHKKNKLKDKIKKPLMWDFDYVAKVLLWLIKDV